MSQRSNRLTTLCLSALLSATILTGAAFAASPQAPLANLTDTLLTASTIHVVSPSVPLAGFDAITVDTETANRGYIQVSGLDPTQFYRMRIDWTDSNGNTSGAMFNIPEGLEQTQVPLPQCAETTARTADYKIRLIMKDTESDNYIMAWQDTLKNIHIRNSKAAALYPTVYVDYLKYHEIPEMYHERLGSLSHNDKITETLQHISRTIKYDNYLAGIVNPTYYSDPSLTLTRKSGICLDYSILTAVILRYEGVPCRVITGTLTTSDGVGSHAWVQVYTQQGKWVYADPSRGIIQTDETTKDLWNDYTPKIQY